MQSNHDNDNVNDDELRRPSKSQLKREAQAVRDLAGQLVELPAGKLAGMSLNESIRDAVVPASMVTSCDSDPRSFSSVTL